MKLIVNPHKIILDKEETVNEKEINISKCTFEFADEITDEFVKEAYFTYKDKAYKKIIVNNECTFPQEVLQDEGTVEVGVVAYLVEDDEEITRYNPSPIWFKTDKGSLKQAQNSEEPTPSEMEQYEQALQDGLTLVNEKLEDVDTAITQANNLDLDATKIGSTTTVEITKKDGTTKTVNILDGEQGPQGIQGPQGPQGPAGKDGKDGKDGTNGTNGQDGFSPSASVTKSGSVATITITDKNSTTTTTISDGTNGQDGTDGVGVPSGGTQGQVLLKNSATDYDTTWGSIQTDDDILVLKLDDTSAEAKAKVGRYITNHYGKGLICIIQGANPVNLYNPLNTKTTVYGFNKNKELLEYYSGMSDRAYYRVEVTGSWDGDVYTCTSLTYYLMRQLYEGIYGLKVNNTEAFTPTDNYNPATKKYVDDSIPQRATMTTATSSDVGKIVQYTGATDSTYTNGYFYIGTDTSGIYSWEQLNVQPSSGGSSNYKYYEIEFAENLTSGLNGLPDFNAYNHNFTSSEISFTDVADIIEDAENEFVNNDVTPVVRLIFKYSPPNQGFARKGIMDLYMLRTNHKLHSEDGFNFYNIVTDVSSIAYWNFYVYGTWSGDTFTATAIRLTTNNFYISSIDLTGSAQTISAKKTYTVLPESSVTPTTNDQLTNKKYVDDAITSAITTTLGGSY